MESINTVQTRLAGQIGVSALQINQANFSYTMKGTHAFILTNFSAGNIYVGLGEAPTTAAAEAIVPMNGSVLIVYRGGQVFLLGSVASMNFSLKEVSFD